jgi:hypothetical protein
MKIRTALTALAVAAVITVLGTTTAMAATNDTTPTLGGAITTPPASTLPGTIFSGTSGFLDPGPSADE